MKKRQNFLMLAAAALLASCSQDDALQNTVNNNEGLKPMTITASLPSEGMQTRAAGDADAARCYVQILDKDGNPLEDGNSKPISMDPDGDSFTTTVYLNGANTYDFLFWADTEETTADKSNAHTDLKAVAYTNGKTIAWAGSEDDVMWNSQGVSIELQHVVSRVTVTTTSDFTVGGNYSLTVTVPTVFSTYNVATGEVTGQAEGYTFKADPDNYVADTEVGHFYVLGNGSNQPLTLWYDGPKENPEITITDVPVSANTHITLKGDIYNAGMVEGNITATTTTDWTTPETGGDINIDNYK